MKSEENDVNSSRTTNPIDAKLRLPLSRNSSWINLPASDLFINREASLLEFHRRVLEEALDQSNPPLERLKFLSIFSSNLDEFFMIRVSGLKDELEEEVDQLSLDGMTPGEQLQMIRESVIPMIAEQQRCLTEEILPQLESEGIVVASYRSLSDGREKVARCLLQGKSVSGVDAACRRSDTSVSLHLAAQFEPGPGGTGFGWAFTR